MVAVEDGQVVGCGALHVLGEDLAEVRSVAITETLRGNGLGIRETILFPLVKPEIE